MGKKKATWWDEADDMFSMIDANPDKSSKKKKKKGKKKAKDSATVSAPDRAEKKARKNLKGLNKSELLQRMDKLGIPLTGIDVEDKKAMKNAIVAKMTGQFTPPTDDKVPVGMSATEHEIKIAQERPPYYIDLPDQSFIIPHCVEATDMDCFNGMMALGAYRRERRPDDGFGELMYRLTKKLAELPEATPSEIIDVTDFRVVDKPDAKASKPDSNWVKDYYPAPGEKVPDTLPEDLVPKRHMVPELPPPTTAEEMCTILDEAFAKGKNAKSRRPKKQTTT